MSQSLTVAFLGASGGVGLAALKNSLAAGHQCIALCRDPSKLTDVFPNTPNLKVFKGDAKDVAAVSQILTKPDGNLVDVIISTIGSRPVMKGFSFTLGDPVLCRVGMAVLLEAITSLRNKGALGKPHIIACSTTGMSKFGGDVPYLMVPLYNVLLKVPHQDKSIMENTLINGGEKFTVVRCSFMVNGESEKKIRTGVEDPAVGREPGWDAIGYTISREDAGRWFAENFVFERNPKYINKTVTITY